MSFGADVFWPAFRAAGMLERAEFHPASGSVVEFDVGFSRPDQVVLDGVALTTSYSIEYQASDVTLARDSIVKVQGQSFKVSEPPRARGSGEFYIAYLERMS